MVLQEMNTDITVINELGKEKKIEVLIKSNEFYICGFSKLYCLFDKSEHSTQLITLTSFL